MGVLAEVLQIVAPVFILASIGFLWVRLGLSYDVGFVTRLAMNLGIPCLIFGALMRTEVSPQALRDTAIAALVAYAAVGTVFAFGLRLTRLSQQTYWAPLTFGNTGNLGLPLALFAFGTEGLDFAVVVFAVTAVLSFTIGVWVVSGQGAPGVAFKEPIVWATLLGGLFLVNGWQLPIWAGNTVDLIGQLGIPLMLITLGVAISQLRPAAIGRSAVLATLKLSVCVAIGWLVSQAIGLPAIAAGVLIVQIATPVAVTNYLLAERFDAEPVEVAGLVVVSTSIAAIALPVLIALLV